MIADGELPGPHRRGHARELSGGDRGDRPDRAVHDVAVDVGRAGVVLNTWVVLNTAP